MRQPTFEDAQLFFQSWGLLPLKEKNYTNGNPAHSASIFGTQYSINEFCYGRMLVDAFVLFGQNFLDFVKQEVSQLLYSYQMTSVDWEHLEEDWNGFNK